MDVRTVPFGHQHITVAACLLAEAAKGSGLDSADPATARRRLEEWIAQEPAAFAAMDASERLLGFMAASASGRRRARVRLDQHAAVAGEQGHHVRCALYRALSERLVGDDATVHEIDVLVADEEAVNSLVRLGFGIDQVKGFRRAAPATWDARVRRARPEDIPRLVELADEVQQFHEQPPMWQRTGPGVLTMVEAGYRRAVQDGPGGPGGPGGPHLLVVAEESSGQLVGLMQAAPDSRFTDAVTIGLAGVTRRLRSTGVGTALLDAVGDWSAGLGFARCGASWTSANPVSDPFWRGRGLIPASYRMARVIDHRIPSDG
jgi:GNAT superfamily N-acetyltransferase